MRIFPRGRNRKTWIVLSCLSCLVVLVKIHDFFLDINQIHPTGNFLYLQHIQNETIISWKNKTEVRNQTLLQLVTASPHAEVLHVVTDSTNQQKNEPVESRFFKLNFSIDNALQYGHFKKNKGFITIAIPSVKRQGYFYLPNTIDSLLSNASPADRDNMTIVIMFSDDDATWNDEKAYNISQKYDAHVQSGLMQILVLPHQTYPDFKTLPRTYNDSLERLKWRSKQNVHYAFLFRYCQNISEYYLHLEDDVIAAKNYITDIRNYRRIKSDNWFLIRFSNMGFIGIFFRSSDLIVVSDFYLLFYSVQPCDFLMNLIAKIKLQDKEIRFRPSLFQHQGIISSLKDKRQVIVDRSFKGGNKSLRRKKYYIINPPAEVDSTLVAYEQYSAINAYKISDLYFWAVSPQKGQTYTVVLNNATTLSALIIVGGYPTKKSDFIMYGDVEVSSVDNCSEWTKIGTLSKGSFDSRDSKDKKFMTDNLKDVTCVQIEVTKNQYNWAIISEIALLQGQSLKV